MGTERQTDGQTDVVHMQNNELNTNDCIQGGKHSDKRWKFTSKKKNLLLSEKDSKPCVYWTCHLLRSRKPKAEVCVCVCVCVFVRKRKRERQERGIEQPRFTAFIILSRSASAFIPFHYFGDAALFLTVIFSLHGSSLFLWIKGSLTLCQ